MSVVANVAGIASCVLRYCLPCCMTKYISKNVSNIEAHRFAMRLAEKTSALTLGSWDRMMAHPRTRRGWRHRNSHHEVHVPIYHMFVDIAFYDCSRLQITSIIRTRSLVSLIRSNRSLLVRFCCCWKVATVPVMCDSPLLVSNAKVHGLWDAAL